LKGVQLTIEGSAKVGIQGAMIESAADATNKVSGSAMTQIQGGMVKIN
jgi:hypothetical protein